MRAVALHAVAARCAWDTGRVWSVCRQPHVPCYPLGSELRDSCVRHVASCMLTVACGMLHVAGLLRGSQNCMAGSRRGSPRASLGERRKGALRTLISTAVAATLASLGERVGFPRRGLIVACCTLCCSLLVCLSCPAVACGARRAACWMRLDACRVGSAVLMCLRVSSRLLRMCDCIVDMLHGGFQPILGLGFRNELRDWSLVFEDDVVPHPRVSADATSEL